MGTISLGIAFFLISEAYSSRTIDFADSGPAFLLVAVFAFLGAFASDFAAAFTLGTVDLPAFFPWASGWFTVVPFSVATSTRVFPLFTDCSCLVISVEDAYSSFFLTRIQERSPLPFIWKSANSPLSFSP